MYQWEAHIYHRVSKRHVLKYYAFKPCVQQSTRKLYCTQAYDYTFTLKNAYQSSPLRHHQTAPCRRWPSYHPRNNALPCCYWPPDNSRHSRAAVRPESWTHNFQPWKISLNIAGGTGHPTLTRSAPALSNLFCTFSGIIKAEKIIMGQLYLLFRYLIICKFSLCRAP